MKLSALLEAALLCCFPVYLNAATFVVDTTSDATLSACTATPGDCSLRGAVAATNSLAGADTIQFNIPNCPAGLCTITWTTTAGLAITDQVTIDGYTQPGAMPNTNTPAQGGLNGILRIELDGAGQNTTGIGVTSSTGPSVIRGLVINRFNFRSGIFLDTVAAHRIEGCYIGTDPTGTIARPNNEFGILVNNRAGAYVIGGLTPDTRNLISGNGFDGMHFQLGSQALPSNGMKVQGNLFGTTASGTDLLLSNRFQLALAIGPGGAQDISIGGSDPNARNVFAGSSTSPMLLFDQNGDAVGPSFAGTVVQGNLFGTNALGTAALGSAVARNILVGTNARGLTIGGTVAGAANRLGSGGEGIALGGRANILGNSIDNHAGLGITFGEPTRVPNDAGDPDTAAGNNRQNFPEISAYNGSNQVTYRVDSAPANSVYPIRVEFFRASEDEGLQLLGSDSYLLAEAQTSKLVVLTTPAAASDVIVATAIDANGNSSEFSFQTASLAIATPEGSPCTTSDSVLCNGFESGPQASLVARITATATSGPFAPNGVVNVSDNRGASCQLTLQPTGTPLTSQGACILANSGAAGAITVTAVLDTF
ncbi:MAG: hypothetical protein ABIP49_01275, partial [Lysobacterales bacterium]